MLYKKTIHILFIVGLCVLHFSCKKYFADKGKELTEQALARVHDKYLYPSDIAGMGAGSSREDSIKMVTMYIGDWIQHNLIIDKAKQNLPKELLDIDKKVEDYKESLIIYNYESELIAQKLNTTISLEEKQKYYSQYRSNFVLNDDIFNLQYIVLATSTPQMENWTKLFKSSSQEDQVQLRSLCKISSSNYEIDNNKWFSREELMKLIEVPIDFFDLLSKNGELIKYNNGKKHNLSKKNICKSHWRHCSL